MQYIFHFIFIFDIFISFLSILFYTITIFCCYNYIKKDFEVNIMETNTSILTLMRSNYNNMTKSEKRIIDYILANLKTVMSQTISDLASNTQSSEITISRFCKN